jgi:predicted dehydrogenase
MAIHYTVSAGPPPRGTWITDPRAGGGRIVGEACHFVDLCSFFVGAPPQAVYARALGRDREADDSLVAILDYPDGSSATLAYLARASTELPKERFEVSADGATARCDNFRTTSFHGGRRRRVRSLNQDKGQARAVAEFVEAVRGGRPSPFALEELAATSLATFAMLESAERGTRIPVGAAAGAAKEPRPEVD